MISSKKFHTVQCKSYNIKYWRIYGITVLVFKHVYVLYRAKGFVAV